MASLLATATTASAQWISFNNQTGTRLPTGAGQNVAALTTTCPEEKDYSWGDVDHDGDLDCLVMRKRPMSCTGGRQNLLLMNEGGVLIDRAATKGNTALNVPGAQGVSQGLLDPTNDRQCVLVDVNNDGWLDCVTNTTMSEGQQRYIGYPRVYMNMGEISGVWQGFRYEYDRIPLFTGAPANAMPRFCGVAAGDVNGDGYVDLFFVDYDGPEGCYCTAGGGQPSEVFDFNNRVLLNQGAANPGFFNNGTTGSATFGAHALCADFNNDGTKDFMRINTLTGSLNIGYHSAGNQAGTSLVYTGAPYGVSTGDLDGDGDLDLIISDDQTDRYALNSGAGAYTPFTIAGSPAEFSGQNSLSDLDNDGLLDALIPDQDIDTDYSTARRMHFYRNTGGAFAEDNTTPIIPQADAKAVYNVATFDIDGNGWRDVILGKGNPNGGHTVGSTQVFMNNGKPALTFTYPTGLPSALVPDIATTFNVQLNGVTGGVPGAIARIFISVNGGGFAFTNMTPLGGNLFQATIPAQECPVSIRYYFTGVESVSATTIYNPPGAPVAGTYLVAASDSTQVIVNEAFEGGAGAWTVQNDLSLTSGTWAVAVPNGTWYEGLRAAPNLDATAAGTMAFVTQNGLVGDALGAADVDGGPTHLISPTIDLTNSNAVVSFNRWFYSNGLTDVLQVSVSNNNGGSWVTVKNIKAPPVYNWNGPGEYTQTAWKAESFQVGDYVTPTNQVRVRFTANDIAPVSFAEAGIDDVVVTKLICNVGTPCPADVNGSNNVDIDDLLAVINAWGPCASCPADVNNSGNVDIDDLLAVINAWGPCPVK